MYIYIAMYNIHTCQEQRMFNHHNLWLKMYLNLYMIEFVISITLGYLISNLGLIILFK